jgi:hypothetical protein
VSLYPYLLGGSWRGKRLAHACVCQAGNAWPRCPDSGKRPWHSNLPVRHLSPGPILSPAPFASSSFTYVRDAHEDVHSSVFLTRSQGYYISNPPYAMGCPAQITSSRNVILLNGESYSQDGEYQDLLLQTHRDWEKCCEIKFKPQIVLAQQGPS